MGKMRIAIPTKEDKGIGDVVSDVFGRSKTFTIINISDGLIHEVEVVKNPAAEYKHGAGPIVIKMLVDMEVTAVASRELGLGASTLLDQNKIKRFKIKADIPVGEAVKTVLKELEAYT